MGSLGKEDLWLFGVFFFFGVNKQKDREVHSSDFPLSRIKTTRLQQVAHKKLSLQSYQAGWLPASSRGAISLKKKTKDVHRVISCRLWSLQAAAGNLTEAPVSHTVQQLSRLAATSDSGEITKQGRNITVWPPSADHCSPEVQIWQIPHREQVKFRSCRCEDVGEGSCVSPPCK